MQAGSLSHTHQTDASSVRPARTKRSPRTLKSRPCEDAAPTRLWRFRGIVTLRVLWRFDPMGDDGPEDALRLIPSTGVVTLRVGIGECSGWLLYAERRDRRSGSSSTSWRGKSAADGIIGNDVAFKYSLPSGLSKMLTYSAFIVRAHTRRRGNMTRTTEENSARMFEHKSASKVSMFSFLLPIMLGMITSPGR